MTALRCHFFLFPSRRDSSTGFMRTTAKTAEWEDEWSSSEKIKNMLIRQISSLQMLWFLGKNVEVNGRFRYIYKSSEIYLCERYVKTVLLSVAVSTVTPMLSQSFCSKTRLWLRERRPSWFGPQVCYAERLQWSGGLPNGWMSDIR